MINNIETEFKDFLRVERHLQDIKNKFALSPKDLSSDGFIIQCKIKFLNTILKNNKPDIFTDEVREFFNVLYDEAYNTNVTSDWYINRELQDLYSAIKPRKAKTDFSTLENYFKFVKGDSTAGDTFKRDIWPRIKSIPIKTDKEFGAIIYILHESKKYFKQLPKRKEWIKIMEVCLNHKYKGNIDSTKPSKVRDTVKDMKIRYLILDSL